MKKLSVINQEMNKKEDSDSTNHVTKEGITPEQYIVTGSTKKVGISARSKVCPDCNKEFYDSSNMKKHHISQHKGVTFPCDQCNAVYKDHKILFRHKKGVHEGQKIKCEYEDCGKEFNFHGSYRKHVRNTHMKVFHSCPE